MGDKDNGRRPARHERLWRNKWLTADAGTIDDMIGSLREAADELRRMKARGVTLADGCAQDDFATLITDDPAVAEEFGFEAEDDLYEDEEGGEGAGGDAWGEGPAGEPESRQA